VLNYTPSPENVWESGGTVPHILNLGARWRWVVCFTSQHLYTRYPMDTRLGGYQRRSGRGGYEKWNPCPYRESTFNKL